jgi:oligopeptide/dipeptide ABC transporter ATP-binding protein
MHALEGGHVSETLVQADSLSRNFPIRKGILGRPHDVWAVNDVDIVVKRGEILGVVGESGCGKSTLGRLLLGLLRPSAGSVQFDGEDISKIHGSARRKICRRMQMIFQDPYASLDPRRSIGAQVADGLRVHAVVPAREVNAEVGRLLEHVGLDPMIAKRRPHEFSGGQRQRIAVARALATRPDFIVADEPVSALDVSIQAQVVNLLADLRSELGLALMFISHDLHVVRHLCDRLVVMYLGRVVEEGPAREVFADPGHPYTVALLGAAPSMRGKEALQRPILKGDLPSPANPPSGCAFRTRCPLASQECAQAVPALTPYGSQRRVACIKAKPGAAKGAGMAASPASSLPSHQHQ